MHRPHRRLQGLVVAFLGVAALSISPLGINLVVPWLGAQPALAKDNGKGGGDRGGGGDRSDRGGGRGDRGDDRGGGHGGGHGAERGGGAEGRGADNAGRGHGPTGDTGRQARADGHPGRGWSSRHDRSDRDAPEALATLSADQTRALIERGWERHARLDGAFRNHGERVRTMVELARALGLDPSVGALQANFGTPYENGLVPADGTLAEPDWSVVDLDVNGDLVVDGGDLAALPPDPAERDAPTTAGAAP